jgi:lipoate-protein ligase A
VNAEKLETIESAASSIEERVNKIKEQLGIANVDTIVDDIIKAANETLKLRELHHTIPDEVDYIEKQCGL